MKLPASLILLLLGGAIAAPTVSYSFPYLIIYYMAI